MSPRQRLVPFHIRSAAAAGMDENESKLMVATTIEIAESDIAFLVARRFSWLPKPILMCAPNVTT